MMLDLSLGLGASYSNAKSPFINYINKIKTEVDGTRKLTNIGSGVDGTLRTGHGMYLNGIDQAVTIQLDKQVQTVAYMLDGVLNFDEVLAQPGAFTIDAAGIHQNYIIYDGIFTQAEKEFLWDSPEDFLWIDNGVLKTATSIDTSKVVAWLPLCESDGYVRDMIKYNEHGDTVSNGDFADGLTGWTYDPLLGTATVANNECTLVNDADGDNPYIETTLSNIVEGTVYMLSYDMRNITYGIPTKTEVIDVNGSVVSHTNDSTRDNIAIVFTGTSDNYPKIRLYIDEIGNTGNSVVFSVVSCRVIDATYAIANYTNGVRSDADFLTYGLQLLYTNRNILGVLLYRSNYMEGNTGVVVGTKWYPELDKDFTIEYIQNSEKSNSHRLNGNGYGTGIFFGIYYYGKSYIRAFSQNISITSNKKYPVISFNYNSATNTVKSYLDGVFVNSASVDPTITQDTTIVNIMRPYDNSNDKEQIHDMRLFKVYDELLTDEQIAENATKYIAQGYTS